ncbi:MAG: hypothetical protein ACR2MZ_00430 [Candidatus Dormibacter sp.]|uniref:hypothetical protein n=1 Tax=Candidatus Dormibacter sp. TaxID=2973982 RepID=UPI000DB4B661|nr:MAG: hypothetical protein DLM66_01520 [Candidatus Dormibacteraeota bacterium]
MSLRWLDLRAALLALVAWALLAVAATWAVSTALATLFFVPALALVVVATFRTIRLGAVVALLCAAGFGFSQLVTSAQPAGPEFGVPQAETNLPRLLQLTSPGGEAAAILGAALLLATVALGNLVAGRLRDARGQQVEAAERLDLEQAVPAMLIRISPEKSLASSPAGAAVIARLADIVSEGLTSFNTVVVRRGQDVLVLLNDADPTAAEKAVEASAVRAKRVLKRRFRTAVTLLPGRPEDIEAKPAAAGSRPQANGVSGRRPAADLAARNQ